MKALITTFLTFTILIVSSSIIINPILSNNGGNIFNFMNPTATFTSAFKSYNQAERSSPTSTSKNDTVGVVIDVT